MSKFKDIALQAQGYAGGFLKSLSYWEWNMLELYYTIYDEGKACNIFKWTDLQ